PRVNLEIEKSLIELLAALRGERLTCSVHDLSNGGLAIALAESAMDGVGCELELGGHADELDAVALLFSESQGRAVVASSNAARVLELARERGVHAQRIGHTGYGTFLIERNGTPLVRIAAQEVTRVWRAAFERALGGEDVMAH
ncbi:MAG: AIR synthase-related protein, partial [Thermoanaerobaculia bacterium]